MTPHQSWARPFRVSLVCCSAVAMMSVTAGGCATTPMPAPSPGPEGDSVFERSPPGADSDGRTEDGGPSSESLTSILAAKHDEGLKFEEVQLGVGPSIQIGDMAKVHYVGRLENGTEFDSSRNRPGTFDFVLGRGMVIRGFERGMVGMRTGGIRRVHIPWRLGYGEDGNPPRIPARANLVFEIELLDIPVPAAKIAPKAPPQGAPPNGGAPPR